MAETIIFYEQGAYNLGKAFVFEKSSAFFLESNFLRISKKQRTALFTQEKKITLHCKRKIFLSLLLKAFHFFKEQLIIYLKKEQRFKLKKVSTFFKKRNSCFINSPTFYTCLCQTQVLCSEIKLKKLINRCFLTNSSKTNTFKKRDVVIVEV